MKTSTHSRRGVSLIEGMVATMILLMGMTGVLQGLLIASNQNSMASRQNRAGTIAQELVTALERQGRARLLATGGVFSSTNCVASVPSAVTAFKGDLSPTPVSLTNQGYTTASTCYVDFDALGTATSTALTPAYSAQDNTTYQRVIALYRHPTNDEVMHIGVSVGWRDMGIVHTLKRFTVIYDTTTNQTTLEF